MRGELSKSKYMKGIQCPKMLWMDEHMPQFAVSEDASTQIENGKMVGELARKYFGGSMLVPWSADHSAMVGETVRLMEAGAECIAEASFLADGLFCSVDILRRTETGYDIVEVKSTTEVREEHLEDVGYQYHVLVKSGIPIDHIFVMYINNKYVRQGELDLQGLFVMEDCTEEAKDRSAAVSERVQEIRECLCCDEEPKKDIDICCEKPHKCVYFDYCRKHVPTPSVFDISNFSKKYEYYHNGIVTFEDIIKKNAHLSDKQRMQVETTYYKKSDHIDRKKIREFLDTLSYPIYHLDFETYNKPVPEFDGTWPYEQIPFQYSLHIEQEDGTLEHREYLAEAGMDPRREIAEHLVRDIPDDVCILAYNMSFEKGRLKELADMYPDLAEHLMNMRDNIRDLIIPFRQKDYYTEAMKGRSTIKFVLPALFPNDSALDYHNLEEVHRGDEASAAFLNLATMSPGEAERSRQNLLKYCCLDTYAMVKVLGKLRKVVEEDE